MAVDEKHGKGKYMFLNTHPLMQRSVKIIHLFAYYNYNPCSLKISFKIYIRERKKKVTCNSTI